MDSTARENELKEQIHKQNKRLIEEEECRKKLLAEIKQLEQVLDIEKNNANEQTDCILSLKKEISELSEANDKLKKHAQQLSSERDNLSDSLDFSVEKIFSLERFQKDQEYIMRTNEMEMEELRNSNNCLLEKLEAWSVSRSTTPSCRNSLNLEQELSASDSNLSLYRW